MTLNTSDVQQTDTHLQNICCTICLDTLPEEHTAKFMTQLPCSHMFHSKCIIEYFMKSHMAICPLCRDKVCDVSLDIDPGPYESSAVPINMIVFDEEHHVPNVHADPSFICVRRTITVLCIIWILVWMLHVFDVIAH